jgi:hypothetical protein
MVKVALVTRATRAMEGAQSLCFQSVQNRAGGDEGLDQAVNLRTH